MKHLDDLEQRLEEAAREVRAAAKHSVPPAPEAPARRSVAPGWLIFAAAFAAVIIAVGVIPLISSPEESGPAAGTTPTTVSAPVTTAPAPITTVPATTTVPPTTVPTADCSAAGMALPPDQEGLPMAVAETRRAILEAAIACDYESLEALAATGFRTSFGGTGFEKIPEWEETGMYPATRLMVQLLGAPYGHQDFQGEPRTYWWPSAFGYDSWDEIPPEDMEPLRSIYTEEELEMTAEFGSYALWRLSIDESGEWTTFIAGD